MADGRRRALQTCETKRRRAWGCGGATHVRSVIYHLGLITRDSYRASSKWTDVRRMRRLCFRQSADVGVRALRGIYNTRRRSHSMIHVVYEKKKNYSREIRVRVFRRSSDDAHAMTCKCVCSYSYTFPMVNRT